MVAIKRCRIVLFIHGNREPSLFEIFKFDFSQLFVEEVIFGFWCISIVVFFSPLKEDIILIVGHVKAKPVMNYSDYFFLEKQSMNLEISFFMLVFSKIIIF